MSFMYGTRALSLRLCLFIFLVGLSFVAFSQHTNKGTFDLRVHDFSQSPANLNGQWEFYFNQLLTPDEFKVHPTEYIRVPGSWNRQLEHPTLGYGTYRCKVLIPQNQNDLLLYIPAISAAANVFINGQLLCSIGNAEKNRAMYKPELGALHATLPEKTDTLEIVVQVVNYSYFGGGILSVPVLGKSDELIKNEGRKNGVEIFFAGSLIAMFIYHIVLFFLYNDRKPNLWLSLICLGVALRGMVINGGSFFLPNLFPFVSFEIWKKVEFGSVYLITAIFPLFIYHLFESDASKKFYIKFFSLVGILLVLPVVIFPQYIYGKLLDVCHVSLMLAFVYAIYTIGKAWKAGNTDAKIIFFGVITSFPFILLEILKNSLFIHFAIHLKYLVELGVLIFLLFQAYTLARHYAKSFKSLELLNLELENTVAERTQELVESNTIKERLLSVISHDVKSPLNSLQGLISVYNNKILPKEEFDKYLKKIEGNLINTSGLVENILYWTANQRKGNEVCMEPVALDVLIKENLNHLQAIINNKSIILEYSIPEQFMITTDRGILTFVIRNLITNAVKFSHPNGKIFITFHELENSVSIGIVDRGIGMTEEQQESFRSAGSIKSTKGTNTESGTGLGLSLCKEFLGKIGGKLEVYSQVDKGSTFTICLPIRKVSPVLV